MALCQSESGCGKGGAPESVCPPPRMVREGMVAWRGDSPAAICPTCQCPLYASEEGRSGVRERCEDRSKANVASFKTEKDYKPGTVGDLLKPEKAREWILPRVF